MPPTRRRRIVRRAVVALAGVVLSVVVYLTSFGLVWQFESIRQNTAFPLGAWREIYVPAEKLIDHTCLREPVLFLTDACDAPGIRIDAEVRETLSQ
jgi:hypothetical protein